MERFNIQDEVDVIRAKKLDDLLRMGNLERERKEIFEKSKNFFLPSGIKIDEALFLDEDSKHLLHGLANSIKAGPKRLGTDLNIHAPTPFNISSKTLRNIVKSFQADRSEDYRFVHVDLGSVTKSGGYADFRVVYRATVFEDKTIRDVSSLDSGFISREHKRSGTYYPPYKNDVSDERYSEKMNSLIAFDMTDVLRKSIVEVLVDQDINWVEAD